ncbi:hypothetical protein D1816_12865 [Aquimarina sp. AD10]|uniref:hypothetical protein n=1 Tax=Aquimarina sp. AD10 TaxID=1714849 RepID=UPI000E4E39A1|nr:hypothetical protein [Aquimarina sp. AD10]AXT61200.1 hypothetical protein D1816_12865 [Aquimarina sp. AD10]RKN02184.1 hypothetical protein D7033_01745 [Aquimarina sp. AD10]
MIQKKLTKLVGLKKTDFDSFVQSGQIKLQQAKLIPTLKTGDEMALTSIFLSTVRLVKEYRDGIFKSIKLSRAGKAYYYTETSFPDVSSSRIDGLIIVVTKGIITDAVFFEMKNKNNGIDQKQVEDYLSISKSLKVNKLVTVSNEFVADSTHSPVKVKVPKNISLYHFSWTYLITKGRILLFKNDIRIQDDDQVEIMSEALHYFESSVSGISGFIQMKAGWKELSESIRAQKALKQSDEFIEEAVLSWYEEEKDMALLLSRKLGVLVKSSSKNKESVKKDIKKVINDNCITGELIIKNAVSDIKLMAEFERRIVSMSVKLTPPLDKGNKAKITWIGKQLENCKKKNDILFSKLEKELMIEADIKYAKANIKVKLSELDQLIDSTKDKEIQAFKITLNRGFGAGFASVKKFIVLIDNMVLEYYEGIVQYVSTWARPTPKIVQTETELINN